MNPAVWDIIAALVSVSLVLGVLSVAIGRTQFQGWNGAPRWLWFLRWARVCMCAHGRLAHPDGGACGRCRCWQWRPFLARRRQLRGDAESLPRRKPAPGLPRDGRPLDEYESAQWHQARRAYSAPEERAEK